MYSVMDKLPESGKRVVFGWVNSHGFRRTSIGFMLRRKVLTPMIMKNQMRMNMTKKKIATGCKKVGMKKGPKANIFINKTMLRIGMNYLCGL
jgi:hypothetical protein